MFPLSSAHRVPARALRADPTTRPNVGWYVVALVPVLIHGWMVSRYAVNMPFLDDYTFVVDGLHVQATPPTVGELLRMLFVPHGEHVIVFARLTALLDYWLEGELNFRTLFFVGNATLLGTAGLLYRIGRQAGLSPWSVLPVSWLLFQPQYYENTMTWAICALQHIPALFLAFGAFYLLTRPSTGAFLLGLPVAFLATFSNGNGLAVLLVGCGVVGLQARPGRWLGWGLFSVASGGLYYYVAHQFPQASPAGVGGNLANPVRLTFDFFLMNGSMGLLFTRSLVGLSGLGLLLTLLFSFAAAGLLLGLTGPRRWLARVPKRWHRWLAYRTGFGANAPGRQTTDRRNNVRSATICLIANYAYLLITLAGIVLARGHGWHQGLLLPRFIWFTTVTVVTGYLLVLLWLRPVYRSPVGWSALLVAVLFNGSAYYSQVDELRFVRQSLMSDWYNWRANRLLVTMPAGTPAFDRYYAELLEQAVAKGVYRLPPPLFDPNAKPSVSVSNLIAKDSSYRFIDRPCRYVALTDGAVPDDADRDYGAYLLLRSERRTFVWPIDQSRTKLSQYLQTGRSNWKTAIAIVFADLLPADRYRLGLAYFRDGRWITGYSSQYLLNK